MIISSSNVNNNSIKKNSEIFSQFFQFFENKKKMFQLRGWFKKFGEALKCLPHFFDVIAQ